MVLPDDILIHLSKSQLIKIIHDLERGKTKTPLELELEEMKKNNERGNKL